MLISITSCTWFDDNTGTLHGLGVEHGSRFAIVAELRPQLPDVYLLELLHPATGRVIYSGTPMARTENVDYNVLAWTMTSVGRPGVVFARVEALEQGILGARLIEVGNGV